MSYMDSQPLAANIAQGSIVLHGQVFGDYENASLAGRRALRRIPGDRMLINNVAFCLTLAGRAREADALFSGERIEGPYLLATRGMIDLGLGKISEGLARYDEAAESARAMIWRTEDAADFIKRLRAQEVLAIHQLHLGEHPGIPEDLMTVRVPKDWRENPDYLVLNRAAERLNVQWVVESG